MRACVCSPSWGVWLGALASPWLPSKLDFLPARAPPSPIRASAYTCSRFPLTHSPLTRQKSPPPSHTSPFHRPATRKNRHSLGRLLHCTSSALIHPPSLCPTTHHTDTHASITMAKESKTKSSTSTGKRTTKAKKDPAAPKRPLSAYMFFSQDHREKVKSENPDAGFGDVGRLLGAKWKEMSDSEKQPYLDMANRDKLRAEAEKAAYNSR
ncbi:Non-histone chromosomal protein 6 [Thecaphora frezii]